MKLNNKGFALTSIIYMLIVLFVMITLLILANLASRKVVLDKIKDDVKTELNQDVTVISQELPYLNIDTGVYYETLELAINKSNNDNTIKVMKNVTDISTVTIATDKEINLDLNGKEIKLDKTITNNGIVDIYSSANDGKITSSAIMIVDNYGTMTTNETDSSNVLKLINTQTSNSAEIISTEAGATTTLNNNTIITFENAIVQGSSTTSRYLMKNQNGTIIINGATLTNKNADDEYNYGILNKSEYNNSRIIVNSGKIETSGISIYNSGGTGNTLDTSAVEINGTTTQTEIKSDKLNAIFNNNTTGMISINGGKINSSTAATIKNNSTGVINISGGTVEHTGTTQAIYNATTGTIEISGGTITSDSAGIYNDGSNSGTINISGDSSITSNTTSISVYSGTLTMNGGNVTSLTNHGIYLNGTGSVTIKNGTISGGRTAIMSGSGNTNITLGEDDENVSTSSPLIISTNNSTASAHGTGIYIEGSSTNVGVLNFYDGIIKGPTNSINLRGAGATQTLPASNLYEVQTGTEVIDGVTYKTSKLKLK